MHHSKSFWFNTAGPYQPCEPLGGDIHADVCIVGGGIAGVSAAYHLCKLEPSVRVVLLEAEVVGYGASGRNAGQLIVQFGGGSLANLVRKYGAANIGEAYRYVHEGIQLIADLSAAEGFSCDFAATGYLKASLAVEGDREIELHHRLFDMMGQASHFTRLSAAEVAGEFRSPYLGSALFDSRGGQFNPLKLVRGVRDSALRRGAEIYENSPVSRIDLEGPDVLLHTGCGSVRAKKVILATNAYSHQLSGVSKIGMGRIQTPLMVKGIVTEPLSDEQWLNAGWPRKSGVNVLSALFYSFAPTVDGRILYVGGYYTSAPNGRSLAPEIEPRLKDPDHLAAFFPALKGVKVAQTWGGPISATADWLPHVGASRDPRLFYASGCWGHGMAVNTQNGRTLAELVLGRSSARTEAFFVKRPKVAWPSRTLASLLATSIIHKRRRSHRKIGGQLDPKLRFE